MDVVSGMNIVIIGGGVTGLFCAHYLMRDKHKVTVVEKSGTGSATSIYNAGLLTPSLAPTPRMGLGKILSTYLGREGPVYISPEKFSRTLDGLGSRSGKVSEGTRIRSWKWDMPVLNCTKSSSRKSAFART